MRRNMPLLSAVFGPYGICREAPKRIVYPEDASLRRCFHIGAVRPTGCERVQEWKHLLRARVLVFCVARDRVQCAS
jgi:hypothetical protein